MKNRLKKKEMRTPAAIYFMALILMAMAAGCNLFSTRNPEEPGTGKTVYEQPTSYDIVIKNFTRSINEKDVENYLACFIDSSKTSGVQYVFIPTPDAKISYSLQFSNWDLRSERLYFEHIKTNMDANTYPVLQLNNVQPVDQSTESVTVLADYDLMINHNKEGIKKEFAGSLRFKILKQTGGFWGISEWTDINSSDKKYDSWSVLKAQFSQ